MQSEPVKFAVRWGWSAKRNGVKLQGEEKEAAFRRAFPFTYEHNGETVYSMYPQDAQGKLDIPKPLP